MDERQIADYFVVAGLPEFEEDRTEEDIVGSHLKHSNDLLPITELAVIFPTLGENVPHGFQVVDTTPTGLTADLNHGSLRSPEVYLCYKRGKDKPPLVDIGIMYEGKERILSDSEIILNTPDGRSANVNNSSAKTYVTYRRARPTMPCNALVVTDICVIITSKGEVPPHAFCIINKNLNKGMVGSDVFLCYKKSMNQAPSITYKPTILSRYPLNDKKSFPLPQSVPLFCLPMGATLEAWPVSAEQPPPLFSTFVLTVSDAVQKVYGSAVTFYEDCSLGVISEKQKQRLLSASNSNSTSSELAAINKPETEISFRVMKSICLLSHWPFFDAFEKFLHFLYNMSQEEPENPPPIPIEKYILHFMEDIPFPSIQRPRILVQLSHVDRLILTQPEDLPLPRSGAGFQHMLMNLGPDNCLLLLLCVLTEQKLLIHSLRPDVLTAVAEAVSMIIFPFKWQCPYIPLCPLTLAEVLHAPVPFLIGVNTRFFDLYEPPVDVNCVDLDTNNITLCDEKRYLSTKVLPKKATRVLRNNLELMYQKILVFIETMQRYNANKDASIDKDFLLKRKEQCLELEIQEAFLKFMVHILKGYRHYLLPIIKAPTIGATDTNSLFDLQNFLRSRDRSYQKFYSLLTRTQMFIRFIEERSFVSDLDAGLAFFDECMEKMEQDENDVHLLEMDESQLSERTVFVSPPEHGSAIPNSSLNSKNGFNLNTAFFNQKKVRNNFLDIADVSVAPGSPLARRTKYEVKSAQKLARKYYGSSELWAKCLLMTCYSLWFIHLPSYVLFNEQQVASTLRLACELLTRIQKTGLQLTDEVCYRVMMQLCGAYSQPMLAVKLLFLMKRSGVQLNAITYGFYNRAVLESKWPSDMSNSSQLLWNKLRNVIFATARLKQMGKKGSKRGSCVQVEETTLIDLTLPMSSNEGNSYSAVPKHMNLSGCEREDFSDAVDINDLVDHVSSNQQDNVPLVELTIESDEFSPAEYENDKVARPNSLCVRRSSSITLRDIATFNRFCSRMGSIVKATGLPSRTPNSTLHQQQYESSAGLLMTGGVNMPNFSENDSGHSLNEKIINSLGSSITSYTKSDSSSDFAVNPSTRSGGRNYHNYYPVVNPNAKSNATSSHDTSDCYQLLTRSESFANDAQILKNLRELKTQQLMHGSGNERTMKTPNNKAVTMHGSGKLIVRKNSTGSRILKESRESSIETLPSSGMGSMDDLMSNNQQFTKLANYNDVSTSGKAKTMPSAASKAKNSVHTPLRKTSVSSLEDLHRRDETDSLNRVCSSPSLKSPIRTPVTENDPLGALNLDVKEFRKSAARKLLAEKDSSNGGRIESLAKIKLDGSGTPVLFDRRKGNWDAGDVKTSSLSICSETGGGSDDEDDTSSNRSKDVANVSEVPSGDAGHGSPFKTSLGNLSSNFKLPFSRYSPSRFSLPRKAESTALFKTQMLQNAILTFSPSSLTSKKSNELFMGGLSSLKNAASTMAKKIDEIKEAISANATPLKDSIFEGQYFEDDINDSYNVHNGSVYGQVCEEIPIRRKISSEFSPSSVTQQLDSWSANLMEFFGDGSRKGSTSNLQPLGEHSPLSSQQSLAIIGEKLYPKTNRDSRIPVAIELIMTTCSKCHHCCSLIYDEEIMAGWLPEDSNLNTKCPFCDKATVPFLYVTILDYRNNCEMQSRFTSQENLSTSLERIRRKSSFNKPNISRNSISGSRIPVDSSATAEEDLKSKNVHGPEPIIVPYLNPMVLRKELESILNTEGDVCLTRSSFVDEHPIIYWNLVWVFERIGTNSHVTGLCLHANSIVGGRDLNEIHPSWSDCDHRNVLVRTLWDNALLHEEVGIPMYVFWNNKNDKQSDLLSALLTDNTTIPKSLMERIIANIQCVSNLNDPIRRVAAERLKLKSHGVNHNHSLYRDILFLTFVAIGKEKIDQGAFDREYIEAFDKISIQEADSKMYLRCDNPNLNRSMYFKHYFKELDV